MLLYSIVPLIGLALLSRKYAERQSRLERQYQGHMAAAEKKLERIQSAGDPEHSPPDAGDQVKSDSDPPEYSTAEDTIIPLAPLTLIFLALALFAAVMLARERGLFARPRSGDAPTVNDSGSR
jgi:hypothetical protein